jgi:hypothetical protein
MNLMQYVVWNSNEYRGASGQKSDNVNQGRGYGHEEWNDSLDNIVFHEGRQVRLFYCRFRANQAETFAENVIFYTSKTTSKLLGYAKNATAVLDPSTRVLLAKKLPLDDRKKRTWALPDVQTKYSKNYAAFSADWDATIDSFGSWYCAPKDYVWLPTPLDVEPADVTGKEKMTTRYRAIQQLDYGVAAKLADKMGRVYDLDSIEKSNAKPTQKPQLVLARVGQGQFRADLDKLWGNSCAVTGCGMRNILRASHIKPWRASNDSERLDGHNGLLLSANIDALFNDGLITFADDGRIVLSRVIAQSDAEALGITDAALRRRLNKEQVRYMQTHRQQFDMAEANR